MVGAGLLINLLAPPKKRRKSSQAEARADQEIFFPRGKKKFPGLLNFLYSIMAKAKNIAVEEIKNTHTFFKKWMRINRHSVST